MKLKTTPEYGTKRTRKRFLWLPEKFYIYETRPLAGGGASSITKCYGKSETLWLEAIEVDEEWREGKCVDESDWWRQTSHRRLKDENHN